MVYVIVGASASGKTTLLKVFTELGCKRVITNTTRKRRVEEGESPDAYFFLSVDAFNKLVASGEMLEYIVYGGNLYGTSIGSIEDNSVVILEPNGYYAIKDALPDVCGIYVKVDEQFRIERAGVRADAVLNRLEADRELFNADLERSVDYVLTNPSLEDYKSIALMIMGSESAVQPVE